MVPEIWSVCDRHNFFVILGKFLPFYLTICKIKILKKCLDFFKILILQIVSWVNAWRYYHFTHVHQKLCRHDVQFLRYGVQQMEGQTGG